MKYHLRLLSTDIFVVALVMVMAHGARFGWNPLVSVSGNLTPPYVAVTVAIAVLWVVMLGATRSREARILGHGPQEFQRVISAGWWTFCIVAVAAFLLKLDISRGYLFYALPLGTLALLAYRGVWRMWVHSQRDAGYLQAQVLVVGPLRTAEQMVKRLGAARRAGYNVVGVCTPPGTLPVEADEVAGVPVVGPLDDAVAQAGAIGAEFILLSGSDAMSLREARSLGWSLEGSGIGLIVAPSMVDVAGPRVQMSPVQGLPLMHVEEPHFSGPKLALKNVADRVGAFGALVVLALPMLAVAAIVRLTSPGPVIFRQVRVGQNQQLFEMLKFRSMVPDAEARAAEVMGGELKPFYKLEHDPRITPFGRFMRRFSIDELPQLINVLRGDMSFVGPRPQVIAEVEHYGEIEHRRLLVKPGLTGLWQVSGRSSLEPEQAIRLDAYYAENWTLGGDAIIVLRTIKAVVGRDGAY